MQWKKFQKHKYTYQHIEQTKIIEISSELQNDLFNSYSNK